MVNKNIFLALMLLGAGNTFAAESAELDMLADAAGCSGLDILASAASGSPSMSPPAPSPSGLPVGVVVTGSTKKIIAPKPKRVGVVKKDAVSRVQIPKKVFDVTVIPMEMPSIDSDKVRAVVGVDTGRFYGVRGPRGGLVLKKIPLVAGTKRGRGARPQIKKQLNPTLRSRKEAMARAEAADKFSAVEEEKRWQEDEELATLYRSYYADRIAKAGYSGPVRAVVGNVGVLESYKRYREAMARFGRI